MTIPATCQTDNTPDSVHFCLISSAFWCVDVAIVVTRGALNTVCAPPDVATARSHLLAPWCALSARSLASLSLSPPTDHHSVSQSTLCSLAALSCRLAALHPPHALSRVARCIDRHVREREKGRRERERGSHLPLSFPPSLPLSLSLARGFILPSVARLYRQGVILSRVFGASVGHCNGGHSCPVLLSGLQWRGESATYLCV